MMTFWDSFSLILTSCSVAAFFGTLTWSFWKKSQVVSSFSIRSATDETEDMTFTFNGLQGEEFESKLEKIKEGFALIQERKNQKHLMWLEAKAKAIKDNEARGMTNGVSMGKMADAATLEAASRAVN